MYFSVNDRGQMHAMVYNWPAKNVQYFLLLIDLSQRKKEPNEEMNVRSKIEAITK
jgi:hypothetical protein